MITKRVNAVLVVGFLIFVGGHISSGEMGRATTGVNDYIGGIAFLLDGEIYLAHLDGRDIKPLTQTEGKVEDFRFSPDLKHLAYTKVIGMVEDVGLWEDGEEVPETETWSIVIFDPVTMQEVNEILPEDDWLCLGKWSALDKLFYYSSSGFDISGYYHYDARRDTIATLDYLYGHRQLFADFSADGDRMLYVDDTGLGRNFCQRLHMVNFSTNEDRIVASKRRIFNPCLSHDLKSAAFVEIQTVNSQNMAVMWSYNLKADSLEKLATLPAKQMSGSSLAWSVGDSCLGLFYSPSLRPNGYIFSLANPSDLHEISGKHFCWAGNDAILYSRGASDMFLYDLKSRKETLLIKKATHPVFLVGAN